MPTLWSFWLERLVSHLHTSRHLVNSCRPPLSRSTPLLYRLFGAWELPGRSLIMPITTLEAGKVDKKTICRDKKLDEVQWSIFRAHHGGWKVHTSKPPTMPDNANYPKKVWATSQVTLIFHTLWNQELCTLHLSGPTLGEGSRWSQWPGLQGVKRHLKSTEAEISRTREGHLLNYAISGWRSSLDAQHRPEPSCTCWSGCQGVAQLIDLWTNQFWKGLKIVRSRNRDSNISETIKLFDKIK